MIVGLCCVCAGCYSMRCLQIPVSSKVSKEDLKTCKTAATESPERRDVFRRYAQLLRARGDYEGIREITARVLEQDDSRTDALYFRAFAQRKQGQTREALTSYRLYAAANDKDPDPHFGIALCYETLGDNAGAIDAYQQYLLR
jgi:Flp pilus assembly protein TadD